MASCDFLVHIFFWNLHKPIRFKNLENQEFWLEPPAERTIYSRIFCISKNGESFCLSFCPQRPNFTFIISSSRRIFSGFARFLHISPLLQLLLILDFYHLYFVCANSRKPMLQMIRLSLEWWNIRKLRKWSKIEILGKNNYRKSKNSHNPFWTAKGFDEKYNFKNSFEKAHPILKYRIL